MFCSTIIPTIGRETLAQAVQSVLNQDTADDREVIVVNDTGRPLPPAAWQQDSRVRLIETQRRKLCVARNTGAAIANGRYLHFLDDDDWLVPGAMTYFRALAQEYPTAGALYGSFELVDDQMALIERHALGLTGNVAVQLVSGCWLQVASVLVRADAFFTAGGFSPPFIASEELDLFNTIALCEDFVGRDVMVAQISRGQSWRPTGDYSVVYEYNRLARERALSAPHAYVRLRASAKSGYWNGRLLRLYLVSMLWNWRRQKRLFTGLSRGAQALQTLAQTRQHLFSAEYWRAVRDHVPRVEKV